MKLDYILLALAFAAGLGAQAEIPPGEVGSNVLQVPIESVLHRYGYSPARGSLPAGRTAERVPCLPPQYGKWLGCISFRVWSPDLGRSHSMRFSAATNPVGRVSVSSSIKPIEESFGCQVPDTVAG
jgi:hypothetical protein